MALSTFDQVVSALAGGQKIPIGRDANFTPLTLAFHNQIDPASAGVWKGSPAAGSFASQATGLVVVTGGPTPTANTGCIPFDNPVDSGKTLYLGQAHFQCRQPGTLMIFDRIANWNTINTGSNTTTGLTVPASPDPRWYNGGVGVECWFETHVNNGTSRTLTLNYTNSAGVAARTSQTLTVPASEGASPMYRIGLAAGDRGIRSIQSATIAATGNANFAITLLKQIAVLPVSAGGNLYDFSQLGLPIIPVNCGLSMAFAPSSVSGAVQMDMSGILTLIEG
jgi:hypothetical protein